MRLGIAVFWFLPDGEGLKDCTMTNIKALAHIVPDKTYPGMWRVVSPDGSFSDMVNKTRAKDVAWGVAGKTGYLGIAPLRAHSIKSDCPAISGWPQRQVRFARRSG